MENVLNIVATCGRRVDALVCGLFISRWVLAALVKSEFGLCAVIGVMTMDGMSMIGLFM